MGKPLTISEFKGIAPAKGANVPPGWATIAENVDLTSGHIKGLMEHSLTQTESSADNSLFYHNGSWKVGNNKFYVRWKIEDSDILFFVGDDKHLYKIVNNNLAVRVGQTVPGKPTVTSLTTIIEISDIDKYKWKRSLHGQDEYYCLSASGNNPNLAKPDKVTVKDHSGKEGTLGKLMPWQWAYGMNDGRAFNTVYIRLPKEDSSDYINLMNKGAYRWVESPSKDGEYYVLKKNGANPNLGEPEEVIYTGTMFNLDPSNPDNWGNTFPLVRGRAGNLAVWQWDFRDNDSIGFSTVYFNPSDNLVPMQMLGHSIMVGSGSMREQLPGKIMWYSTSGGGIGRLDGGYYYIVTTTRNVAGHEDESGPSPHSVKYQAKDEKLRITRQAIDDTYVTKWNLYRMSTNTGTYQFLRTLPIGDTYWDDNLADSEIVDNPAITTIYTSPQGNLITFAPPLNDIDGIATDVHASMLFIWKGNQVAWCEPGYPDAWPYQYACDFPATVQRCIPFAGTMSVLTKAGPQRLDGTNPELMQPSKVLGEEPCIGTAACPTSRGVTYLSDSGLVLFNLVETTVFTDGPFDETWFKANVNPVNAVLEENDGILYLLHAGGTLRIDARAGKLVATTLTVLAYGAHKRLDDGELYVMDANGIKKLHGGSTRLSWRWRSGDLLFGTAEDKLFPTVRVRGSGSPDLTLYLDGDDVSSKTLGFDMERDRSLSPDNEEKGRSLQFMLEGDADEITEVAVEASAL